MKNLLDAYINLLMQKRPVGQISERERARRRRKGKHTRAARRHNRG